MDPNPSGKALRALAFVARIKASVAAVFGPVAAVVDGIRRLGAGREDRLMRGLIQRLCRHARLYLPGHLPEHIGENGPASSQCRDVCR